jgi:hypothetical protein
MSDTCRGYEVDGQPVNVRGDRPLDEAGQAALVEIFRAVVASERAKYTDAELEEMGRRQQAAIERVRNRAKARRP